MRRILDIAFAVLIKNGFILWGYLARLQYIFTVDSVDIWCQQYQSERTDHTYF